MSRIAIDAGQTGIKVRVSDRTGARTRVFPGIRTHEPLLRQLAAVASETLGDTDASTVVVSAGVSGLTEREADAGALLGLVDDRRVVEVRLAHDSTTSYLGALGTVHGAVVASGTGVVTLAVGASRVARVDGWGHIMGDAGSGYWIGREALDAVMRAYDGRGPHSALRAAVEARWPDLSLAYIDLQSSEDRVSTVASFAEAVARAASAGDPVACAISVRAGAELAISVQAALRRVGENGETFEVCAIGGVLRSPAVADAFATRLAATGLSTRLIAPRGDGLDGAAALADLPGEHPLSDHVSIARV
ncbi:MULTISPECIES: BadF/BadG/BcrA/BcrD ATPase family protein [Microbacterium]|uniref:N-acetylglucosamine kinase n=1 Tax=Microbacterium TaxID=33882 RepID=UPI00146F48B6|nr:MULTISPECIES: BadF/BadG/BcrA/BcrD ATPase family protein [Microbacterium]